ncbi:hypothetical protein LDENG_00103700, partial [Lucifuga dentata]
PFLNLPVDLQLPHQQYVKVGFCLILSSSALAPPQRCVLSPLLFVLYTNDCTSNCPSVKLLMFADDTNESPYREEVSRLVSWCDDHNLELNTTKTQEMIIDFRRKPTLLPLSPLSIHGTTVSRAESVKLLGTVIQQNLQSTVQQMKQSTTRTCMRSDQNSTVKNQLIS